MIEEVLVAAVRVLGLPKAGDLPDRPGLASVHARVDAERVRVLARQTDVVQRIEPLDIRRGVDVFDRDSGAGLEPLTTRFDPLIVLREPFCAPAFLGLLHPV